MAAKSTFTIARSFFWVALAACCPPTIQAFSAGPSTFLGNSLCTTEQYSSAATLTMRKQKASDRRTRRMQRGEDVAVDVGSRTMTSSPMASSSWAHKKISATQSPSRAQRHGRGRSRKRSNLYNTLSSYHGNFLSLLTDEYRAEEEEVLSRIKASVDNPLALEEAGYALFDLFPERRGNLFSDEVYRLTKANDASTTYSRRDSNESDESNKSGLPLNHKFSSNDVIVLTAQPRGSGDFFGPSTLPTSSFAVSVEARVLNVGPTYVDIAMPGGAFEATFGPAPNNKGEKKGDSRMRLRADLFFSNIPYTRMVQALGQITSIPDRNKRPDADGVQNEEGSAHDKICMDEVIRDAILSTFAFNDASSPAFRDMDACDLREMSKRLAKPPLQISAKLAKQAVTHIQSNPHVFRPFNGPQLTAIEAALTRRMTLIQGPPGTGKTTVASAIAFGFVHQCHSISPNTKVLACAFSNVGADNLAEQMVKLGLKVVRIGKASAVSESLWDYTLDAAIDRDPKAQKALENAAWATSQLSSSRAKRKGDSRNKSSILSERSKQDVATAAVKASIEACNIAATKALREADVIVTTSTGASDPRLLAACGIVSSEDEALARSNVCKTSQINSRVQSQKARVNAPDDLPPLSLPFVIVDEACQSVEPASLIPVTSTNSCRSLVLLGDPCQLPATIRASSSSPLSVSLMERLAATLPQPVIVTAHADHSEKDESFLGSKPTRQAISHFRQQGSQPYERHIPYRKRFNGSLLLSVQYRMHPSISAFSSALFYDGLLSTPTFLASQRDFPEALVDHLPSQNPVVGVRFVDVGGHGNERLGSRSKGSKTSFVTFASSIASQQQTSYWNEEEAIQVMAIVKEMLRTHDSEVPYPNSIGIVTPYNGQVELIKSLMATDEEYISLSKRLSSDIEVKSVDGYQGRERDIIIFSAVRSNRESKVGFLSDWRRMNVALTRARSALVVIGDLAMLSEGDSHWSAFGKWCDGMKCIVEPSGSREKAQ